MARVPYITAETGSGEVSEILGKLHSRGVRMHILEAVANSTGAFRNFVRLGNSLVQHARLPATLREIVILHLGQRLDCPYEWKQHEPIARTAGVRDDQMEALKAGDLSDGAFSHHELAILKFAEEAVDCRLTDETFALARSFLDVEQVADLALTVAWWGGMVPRVVQSLQIEPEES